MNEAPQIESALMRLSVIEPPDVPPNAEANVWRRIRHILAESVDWRPDFWPRWLTSPAFGMGLVSACVALGVLLMTSLHVQREPAVPETGHGPSLSIFSDRAPGMVPIGGVREH